MTPRTEATVATTVVTLSVPFRLTIASFDLNMESFAFVDGTKTWPNAAELMKVLAADPQMHLCYAKKLASFGLQRDVVTADLPLLNELAAVSTSSSASVKQVIVSLVQQNAFRIRAGGMP